MRLNLRDKWVLGVVAAFTAAWGAAAVIAAFWNPRGIALRIASAAMSQPIGSAVLGAAAILAALQLFALIWPDDARDIVVRDETDVGRVQIALRAVEALAMRSVAGIVGVASARVGIRVVDGALAVRASLVVDGSRTVPEVTADAQSAIERMLSGVAGVQVGAIDVRVLEVTGGRGVANDDSEP